MTTDRPRHSENDRRREPDDVLHADLDPDPIDAADELPDPQDYRRLRHDYPPGGETTREQGYGAPEDTFPPAEQTEEEYAETPAGSPGGEMSPDEPDFPPPEGRLPDDEGAAVTLADAARDLEHGVPTFPAPLGVVPSFREESRIPPEAIDEMTEERSDTNDPSDELERREEDPEYGSNPADTLSEDSDSRAAADLEERLDEAVMETFPASDSIAPAVPESRRRKG
jgi:hypothetical protein